MTWKDRLHPPISNAEIEIFAELSRLGLTKGMVTQQPIILRATIPDFTWNQPRKCLYLDGEQVHRKHQERDEEITVLLEQKGWSVLRIPYVAPMAKDVKTQILKQIQEFLGCEGLEAST